MRFSAFAAILTLLFLFIQCSTNQTEEDSYLWLEEVEGEKALAWSQEHNDKTKAELESDPRFAEIFDKNLEIMDSKEKIARPSIRGNYAYNFWKDEDHERGILRRTSLKKYLSGKPAWETVLDMDALSQEEGKKWVYKGTTWLYPDYRFCMIKLSPGGSDASEYREFDTKTMTFVDNGFFLPQAKGSVSWLDINTLIVSTDFGEGTLTTSGYPRMVKKWIRGTKLEDAELLYEGKKENVGTWGYVDTNPERKYLVVADIMTTFTSQSYVFEKGVKIKLEIPEDAEMQGFFMNQMLVSLKSDWEINGNSYPQGALIAIDYDDFLSGDRNFKVIITPDDKSSISSIGNTKNLLTVNMITNVRSSLFAYTLKNGEWEKHDVPAPELGTIRIVSSDKYSDKFFFTYMSYLKPTTLYFGNGYKSEPEKISQLPAFFDDSRFAVSQHWATSKDGTKIPYFQIGSKELETNSKNPTLIYGYGGFEVSLKPRYSATVGTSWLERGGVYVVANIRGGGEFGPQWHQAALKENRQRAFDDYIAVAQDLIERKVTSPKHLGIEGGSNGGLLVGTVFVQRPDLYGAVVCEVPLLDMKRYNKLLAGASWMGEYGDPDIPEEWAYISKYSPYQNVKPGQKYPVVFFYTSTRDDRVHPAHARKMVARMEEMGYNVFYYENMEGGHSAGSTNKQRALLGALSYTYLLRQLK